MPNTITTPYGTVHVHVAVTSEPGVAPYVTIRATNHELYSWANRPGAHWPCSDLACVDPEIRVDFMPNGDLVDIDHPGMDDVSDNELSAWSTDVLASAGLRHPAARA